MSLTNHFNLERIQRPSQQRLLGRIVTHYRAKLLLSHYILVKPLKLLPLFCIGPTAQNVFQVKIPSVYMQVHLLQNLFLVYVVYVILNKHADD